jgi:hypothetical protein
MGCRDVLEDLFMALTLLGGTLLIVWLHNC